MSSPSTGSTGAETTGTAKPTGTTKKQRRKATQRRQLLTFLAILVLVMVVAAAVWGVQRWMDSRPGPQPEDLRITAVVNGEEREVAPYSVCEISSDDCDEDEPTELAWGPDDEVTFKIPEDVSTRDWRQLQIFDDPAANSEDSYAPNEKSEVTIKGSSDLENDQGDNPRLGVVEIRTLMVAEKDGEEEPYGVVWSFAPESE